MWALSKKDNKAMIISFLKNPIASAWDQIDDRVFGMLFEYLTNAIPWYESKEIHTRHSSQLSYNRFCFTSRE